MNLKEKFIEFFVSKGHKQILSAPVVPENDPSVLFNTAGMQPLIPYLMGETHPYGTRLCDYQKCVRTNDLDSIGDTTHHTFFEMLGNWSLGDYFKDESIGWSFEFLTKVLNIPVKRLAVRYGENEVCAEIQKISANIYPNPTTDFLNIEIEDLTDGTISIFSVNGSLVKEEKINGTHNSINVSTLRNGNYFFRKYFSNFLRIFIFMKFLYN